VPTGWKYRCGFLSGCSGRGIGGVKRNRKKIGSSGIGPSGGRYGIRYAVAFTARAAASRAGGRIRPRRSGGTER
jgi:hypothetical protein